MGLQFGFTVVYFSIKYMTTMAAQGYFSKFGIKNLFYKKPLKRYDLKHSPQFRDIVCVKIYPFLDLSTATPLLLGTKFSEFSVSISEVFLRFTKISN